MKKELKISVVCLLGVLSGFNVNAAPSVKMLGGTSAFSGTSGATSVKSDAQTLRTASIKAGQSGMLKPSGVKAISGEPTTARLSLGKFLHNSGVSKGVVKPASEQPASSSNSNTGVSSSELISLQDRVRTIENNVSGIRTNVLGLQDHTNNSGIHVSSEEKAVWNAKQDALTAGSGITISNGIISAHGIDGDSVTAEEKATWNAKQDALTAGSGITISNGVISAHGIDGESVSAEEKATWNAKQNALSAGNGINIENGVVSVDTSILPTDTSDAVIDLQNRVSETETHVANTGVHVTAEEKATWNSKQGALTAGSGITISNGVISAHGIDGESVSAEEKATWNAKQNALSAGNGINIENGVVSVDTSILPADTSDAVSDLQGRMTTTESHILDSDVHVTTVEKSYWDSKQDTLSAGEGIVINDGVISADVDMNIVVDDADVASGKMVNGIAVEDNVMTITRGNVKIPVGSEDATPTATIWVE
ncbi:MAG: hypothetical protein IKZ49_00375 [Alphaproteobacteria bacterium]|nr:hypothetical protein [Alphaproteobacteria bacterium]